MKKDKEKKSTTKEEVLVPVTIKRHRDTNGNHLHAIMDDVDKNHVSVGLTTKSKKGKNHPNIPLEKNPLGGDEKSYMRRQGTVARKKEYFDTKQGKMTRKDFAKATVIADKAKRKHAEKSNKKK